jgi:putative ABC transport system permease protein
MSTYSWFGRLRTLAARRRRLRDHDEEVDLHLSLLVGDLQKQGWTREAAEREARRRFGSVDQVRERYRDVSGFPSLDAVAQDLRYGARMIRRQPGFSALVVLLVAIGVGANTAIFSLVEAILLRPLRYPHADRLAIVREVIPLTADLYPSVPASSGDFLEWRSRAPAFESLASMTPGQQTLSSGDQPVYVNVVRATAALLPMLGARTIVGRTFTPAEDFEGHENVVVLSHQLWVDRFGALPGAVGNTITLDGRPYAIVGVLAPGLTVPRNQQLGTLVTLPDRIDVFRPAAFTTAEREGYGDNFQWVAIGRLRPDVTLQQAQAQVDAVQADIARRVTGGTIELKSVLVPLQEQVVGGARRRLILLAGSAAAVLLVLCVNLASVLMTRTSGRARESAVRTALGASRARIVRQLVLENMILALTGGVVGVACAWAGLRALVGVIPDDLPRLDEVTMSPTALGVGLGLSLVTGLVFSLLPAWRLGRTEPQSTLHATRRSSSEGRGAARVRRLLVTGEVALSTVLVSVAALLIASFARLTHVDKGFTVSQSLFADIELAGPGYEDGARRIQFFDTLLSRARALPGARAVTLVSQRPLTGEAQVQTMVREHSTLTLAESPVVNFRFVDPGYFRALGITLRQGRLFEMADRNHPVAVINERTAAAVWPGQNAVGRKFQRGGADSPLCQVIGIVSDTREVGLQKDPVPMGYLPYWAEARTGASLMIVTDAGQIAGMAQSVRRVLAGLDPTIPAPPVTTFMQAMSASVAPERFQMWLVGAFAGCALLLASLGIYGVPAFAVVRRSQELAIRLALGAEPRSLVRTVVVQGLAPVVAGTVLGLAGAIAVGRSLQSLLFDISATDPLTLALVVVVFIAIGFAACYLPARRIAAIDPVETLRAE